MMSSSSTLSTSWVKIIITTSSLLSWRLSWLHSLQRRPQHHCHQHPRLRHITITISSLSEKKSTRDIIFINIMVIIIIFILTPSSFHCTILRRTMIFTKHHQLDCYFWNCGEFRLISIKILTLYFVTVFHYHKPLRSSKSKQRTIKKSVQRHRQETAAMGWVMRKYYEGSSWKRSKVNVTRHRRCRRSRTEGWRRRGERQRDRGERTHGQKEEREEHMGEEEEGSFKGRHSYETHENTKGTL